MKRIPLRSGLALAAAFALLAVAMLAITSRCSAEW